MYCAIRRYSIQPGSLEQVVHICQQGFVPLISTAPGFLGFYLIYEGDDRVTSISIFEDESGSRKSTELAAEYVAEHMAQFLLGAPTVTSGEVKIAQSEKRSPS